MNIGESILVQGVIFVIGLFLLFIFKNYYPKYFETKGANQATKEDIGEITQIVESIKTDLLKRTEELKAQLSLTNQHLLSIKAAERDAIFDYNRKNSAWLYYLVRFKLSGYNLENYKELKRVEQEFAKIHYECDIAESHLVLFMHDEEFLLIKKELTINIIKYESIVAKGIHDIFYEYSKCEFDAEIAEAKYKPAIRGGVYEKIKPILEKFHSETLEQYAIVHDQHIKFRNLIYKRIQKIAEEVSLHR